METSLDINLWIKAKLSRWQTYFIWWSFCIFQKHQIPYCVTQTTMLHNVTCLQSVIHAIMLWLNKHENNMWATKANMPIKHQLNVLPLDIGQPCCRIKIWERRSIIVTQKSARGNLFPLHYQWYSSRDLLCISVNVT